MVGVLAAGLWHTMLYSTVGPAILALSKAHYNAFANLVFCISLFVFIPVGFHFLGCWARWRRLLLETCPSTLWSQYAAYREKVGTLLQDALTTIAFVSDARRGAGLAGSTRFWPTVSGIH